jgi:hypothetical protein
MEQRRFTIADELTMIEADALAEHARCKMIVETFRLPPADAKSKKFMTVKRAGKAPGRPRWLAIVVKVAELRCRGIRNVFGYDYEPIYGIEPMESECNNKKFVEIVEQLNRLCQRLIRNSKAPELPYPDQRSNRRSLASSAALTESPLLAGMTPAVEKNEE